MGANIVDAAEAAGLEHVVYVSVAGADRRTDVPLFESKRQVEEYLSQSSLPFTIIAPVYFMDNLWNPWNLPVLAAGRFPSPIPPARKLQQIPLGNVIDFAAYALGRRDEFIGRRVEIASDDLSALEAVEVVADLTGRRLEVDTRVNGGPLPLFWWLDRVGYTIELNDLRERFPDIHRRRFRAWAQTQDWSLVTPATA
jgi:uncharacterized protein YbjT (DUF2867 family)